MNGAVNIPSTKNYFNNGMASGGLSAGAGAASTHYSGGGQAASKYGF